MADPNVSFFENHQVAWGFGPIELTAARTGDVASFKNYRRIAVLFLKGIGTAGQDPTLTVLQGTDTTFGTNKALNFTKIYTKQDPTQLSDVGQWTKVTQSAGNTYTDLTSAEQAVLWGIDFKAEDLDINGGYDCVRVACSDVGTNTQLGAMIYIGYDPVNSTAPENMASMISD